MFATLQEQTLLTWVKQKKCVCYCNLDIPVSKVTKTEVAKFIAVLSTECRTQQICTGVYFTVMIMINYLNLLKNNERYKHLTTH